MSDNILAGDFTVYYLSDNRQKRIEWTGSASGVRTVQELYSALQDLFDESAQMDEGIPMSAQTPTEYTLGIIDAGDDDPWFIDEETAKHLRGGAITTTSHTRVQDSNVGIVHVPRSGSNIVPGDIGLSISHAAGDTGTLLDINDNSDLVIRPTNATSTHNWDSTSGNITCNGHVDTQAAASTSGETIWANIYTLGTIADETELYIVQDGAKITSWWPSGHIDILVEVQHIGAVIDYGILTIYSRQYTKNYDHFTTMTTGGRNPIPLSVSNDLNNFNTTNTGYRQFTATGVSGTFNTGNYFYFGASWAAATKKARLTAVSGAVLTYYLLGDLTDFTSGNAITEWTGTANDATATAGTPANFGVPTLTGITFTFGADTKDLSNGNGARPYDLVINCGGNTLANFYEYTKYVTRRGSTTSLNGHDGEQYITTGELRLSYESQTVNFLEGSTLTGQTSGATGVIVADHEEGTSGVLVVRDVRQADTDTYPDYFSPGETIEDSQGSPGSATLSTGGIEYTLLSKTAPFGTFAGGKFFGARGVFIENMAGGDANNYSLVDSENIQQDPPATVAITVNGVISGDRVSVFRATDTNGTIDKTYLTSHNTNNVAGDTTFDVTATIPSDTPSSGQIRVVNNPNPTEHRFRYASWSGTIFTLVTTGIPSGTIDAVGDVTGSSFYATNANLVNILPGDLVRNTSDGSPGSWAHVITITNTTGNEYYITHTPLQGGTENDWDVGDGYSFNNLPVNYTSSDTAYVPYLDQTATTTSVSTSVQYVTDRNVTTRVRRKGIQPFNVNNISLTSSGYTATAVRTTDSIVT